MFCAALLVSAPALGGQDDDMPDGDVDLVEKQKPKRRAQPRKKVDKPRVAPVVDDDVLTEGNSGARIAPITPIKAAEEPAVLDDDKEGGGTSRLVQPIEETPVPPAAERKVDVPAPTPVAADDGVRPVKVLEGVENGDLPGPRATEPPAGADGGDAWVIAGATVGGLLILAGAGVGGFFLVDALAPKTGVITVTPR
jgi:hypothetical protein